MSPRRFRPARFHMRRDANEGPIVDTLEARGFHVTKINGTGVPDLLVSKHGAMWLAEVKTEDGEFQKAQVKWQEQWQGPPICVLRSVEDAIAFPTGASPSPARPED